MSRENIFASKAPVLIDMDSVLADFDGKVYEILEASYPHIKPNRNRPHFYIHEDYPEGVKEEVRSIARQSGFFKSLGLVKDALIGWQRIIDLGYEPRVCTTPLRSNLTCVEEKYEWLERYFVPVFGKSVVKLAIMTRDKQLQNGIALIDDRPEIESSESAVWQQVIFDRSYNRYVNDRFRICGWLDPNLPEILDKCNELYKPDAKKPCI